MNWAEELAQTAPDAEQIEPAPDPEQALKDLPALDPITYDQRREREAERLGIRVTTLDKEVARHRPYTGGADQDRIPVEEIEPWPHAVPGLDLAEDLRKQLLTHVVFPGEADADAIVLWCLGTFLIDEWRLWPKLLIQSPEKRCGKSTLLEVVEAHTNRASMTSNITAAALFRCIEAFSPTLLIDEADRFLREDPAANGIINAGHTRRTAKVIRTVEVNGEHVPKVFSVRGAQAIASIGGQMDTLEDRSIRIGLRRRLETEHVADLPVDFFDDRAHARRRMARWGADNARKIAGLDIRPPSVGNDRARNNWTPLFRIAAALGGPWPERVQRAYLVKEASDDNRDEPAGEMVLRDVMGFFDEQNKDRLQTADIVSWLIEMEDRPWSEWKRNNPMTAQSLSRLLKPFGVHPKKIRFGAHSMSGYERGPIADAFARYCAKPLPIQSGTLEQSNEINGLSTKQSGTERSDVPVLNQANALKVNDCSSVPVRAGGSGLPEDIEDFQ